jgi:polyhydroxyalkanoate synthesis regulator phasin
MSLLRSLAVAAVATCSLSISSHPLYAQTTASPDEQALRQRVEDLERQLKQLEERFNQLRKEPAAASRLFEKIRTWNESLPIPAEKIQWLQEQMVTAGNIPKVLELKAVAAPEFREKALKLVGPNG